MDQPECWLLYTYYDNSARLVDAVVEPFYGTSCPLGSNWQVGNFPTQEEAEAAKAAYLEENKNLERGHWWSHVF